MSFQHIHVSCVVPAAINFLRLKIFRQKYKRPEICVVLSINLFYGKLRLNRPSIIASADESACNQFKYVSGSAEISLS